MEDPISHKRLAFAEEMGFAFEHMGSTRMIGRVFGALLVADPPEMSAEEIAEFLHASRGSISQTTRQLVQIALIERVRKPGVRRDYFRVRRHAWVEASRQRIAEVERLKALFSHGLDTMANAQPESRRALEESIAFMDFWMNEAHGVFARWKEQSENQHGDSHTDA